MTRSIRHVGIVVKKIDDLLPFYRDLLEMKPVRTSHEDQKFIDQLLGLTRCQLVTVKLSAHEGSTLLELLEFASLSDDGASPLALCQPGISHIALTITGLDDLYKKLSSRGIHFVSPPIFSPDGKAKVAFCKDPAGNYLELVEEYT